MQRCDSPFKKGARGLPRRIAGGFKKKRLLSEPLSSLKLIKKPLRSPKTSKVLKIKPSGSKKDPKGF
jgi:hypothetical protein